MLVPLARKWFGEGKHNSRRRPRSRTLQVEYLEDRLAPAVRVAVVQGLDDNSGFTALANQLNNDTFFDFSATVVSSSQVDTAAELNNYDAVVIGSSGLSSSGDPFNDATFTAALRTWVQGGGGVVATGWTIFGAGNATPPANADINAIIPVNTAGSYNYFDGGSAIIFNGVSHPVTTGVGNFGLSSGDYAEFPATSPQVDGGATVLGTINGSSSQPTVVVGAVGTGRGVYLGPVYSGYGGYNTTELRSGNPDRLLEQAVNWVKRDAVAPTILSTSPDLAASPFADGFASLQVNFSETVLGGGTVGNYELRNTDNNSPVTLAASYSGTTATLTFAALPAAHYRFTAKDTLTDDRGNALDGDNNGSAGGSYVRDFTVANVAPTVVGTNPSLATGTLAAGVTSLQVTFSEIISGGAVAANYELRRAGADGLLGTVDDPVLAVTPSYAGMTATLNFAALPEDVVRLTVKDSITDLVGNQLDGDANGAPGGNWVRDLVVGALAQTLTSPTPDPFNFDPEFGGFGAGQLVQGTANAFDGLNRLIVNAVDYAPATPSAPVASVQEISSNTSNSLFGGFADVPGLSFTAGSGGTYRFSASLSLFNTNGGGLSAIQYRFVVNGGGGETRYAALPPGTTGVADTVHLEDYVSLNAGDQVRVQAGLITGAVSYSSSAPQYLRVVKFNDFAGGGPSVTVQEFSAAPNSSLSSSFTDVPGLSAFSAGSGGTYRLSASLNLLNNTGGLSQIQYRFTVNGSAGETRFATLGPNTGGLVDALHLEDYLTLNAGDQVRVQAAVVSGAAVYYSSGIQFLRAVKFNDISAGSPSVAVQKMAATSSSALSGAFTDVPGLSSFTASAGGTYRLSASLSLVNNTGGPSGIQYRFTVNGSGGETRFTALAPGTGGFVETLHLEDYVTLTAGDQVRLQAAVLSGAANYYSAGVQNLRVLQFNDYPVAATDDGGRTVLTGTQTFSGLMVAREITVPSAGSEDFARTVDLFTNPTGSPITASVHLVGNLGSDAATMVFNTSDGDTSVEASDQWVGTDDADGSGTPAIIHYVHGPFGLRPTAVAVTGDNIDWTYSLTVPAGQTVRLAHFTILSNLRADAVAAANALVTSTAFGGQAAAFLTQAELDSLRNFEFNRAPTDLAFTGSSVLENSANGTTVGSLSTTDPNAGDTFSYTLLDNAGGRFGIAGDHVVVADGSLLNYEANASHNVTIRSTDAGGLFADRTFSIAVTNANEAPTDIGLSNTSVREIPPPNSAVGNLSSLDPDLGDTFTYTLQDNAGGRFGISGSVLMVVNPFLLDYESNTSHNITIRSTDAGGLYVDKTFTITVTNINEAPTAIGLSNSSVPENSPNGSVVGDLSTLDPDAGDSFTYSLQNSAGGRFGVAGAQLVVANGGLLDYESSTSHSVTLRSTDAGGLSVDRTFSVAVTNVNEAPTAIGLSSSSVPENSANGTVVGDLSSLDPDAGDTFTYTLLDNAGSRFGLSGGQVVVANGGLLDFESSTSHDVTIRSMDAGGLFVDRILTILVTDVNEVPTISPQTFSVQENKPNGTVVGTVLASDVDGGQSLSFAIVAGNSNPTLGLSGIFAINTSTGQITVANAAALDYETSPVCSLTVRVTDNGAPQLSSTATVTVNLTDVALQLQSMVLHWGTSGQYDLVADPLVLRNRTLPWMNVKTIDLVFTDNLYNLAATLTNSATGTTNPSFSLAHTFNTNTATLNIDPASWLSRGLFSLGLSDSLLGAVLAQTFKVLAGDYDGDGVVTIADSVAIRNRMPAYGGTYSVLADVDGNGVIDSNDYNLARARIGQRVP